MTAGAQCFLDLYNRLLQSWSVKTGRHWKSDNPASGQCGVTALVVNDEFGGQILKTKVNGEWHFYNLINGRRVDFTISQFESPIAFDDTPSNREEALADASPAQYQLLRDRVSAQLK